MSEWSSIRQYEMAQEITLDVRATEVPVSEPCENCGLPVVAPDFYVEKVWCEDGSVRYRHIDCAAL